MTARAREFGIPFGGVCGTWNAITDVPGLTVGYTTLIEGDGPLVRGEGPVRSGVTAILPRGHDGVGVPCAAGWYSMNGNGEMTGLTWIDESGSFSQPILITSTHAIGACHHAAIQWVADHHPQVACAWLLPVVAETWDGYLHDINGGHVTADHARAALDEAHSGPLAEGSVDWFGLDRRRVAPGGAGSVIVIVATDAPLLPAQCKALARRVPMGLARTGTSGSHFSGDIFLAFSTANAGALTSDFPLDDAVGDDAYQTIRFVPWGAMDPFFEAVVHATEEAVVNALVANHTLPERAMIGRDGNRSPAMPIERVIRAIGSTATIEQQRGEQ